MSIFLGKPRLSRMLTNFSTHTVWDGRGSCQQGRLGGAGQLSTRTKYKNSGKKSCLRKLIYPIVLFEAMYLNKTRGSWQTCNQGAFFLLADQPPPPPLPSTVPEIFTWKKCTALMRRLWGGWFFYETISGIY